MEKYLLVLEVIIKGVIRYFVCEMSEEDSEPATRKKMLTALANLLIKENGLEIKDSDMNRYISDVSKKYKNHIAIYNKDFNTSLFKDKDFKNVKNENFIRIMPTRKKPRTTEVIDRRIKSSQGTFYGSPAMMQKYNTKIQALKPYQLFIAKDEVGYYVITEAVTGCSLARSKTKSGLEEILAQITVEQLEKIRKKVVKLILHGENYNTFIPLPKINMELEEEIEKETEIIEEEKGDSNMMNLTKKEIVEMIVAAFGRFDAIVEMDKKYRAKHKLSGDVTIDIIDIKHEVKGFEIFCEADGKTDKQLLRKTKEELVKIYEAVNSVGDAIQGLYNNIEKENSVNENNNTVNELEEKSKEANKTLENPLYQEHIEKTFGEGAVAYVSYDCSLLNVSINKDNVKTYLLNYYLSDGKVVPMYCYEVSKTNILIPKADCIANPLHEQVLKIFDRSLENNQSEATLKKLESDLNRMVELGWFKSKSDKAKNGFTFTIYNANHEKWGYMNMALVDNPRVGFKIKFILKDNGLIEVVRGIKMLGGISTCFTVAEKKKFEQETINKRIEKFNAMNSPAPVKTDIPYRKMLELSSGTMATLINEVCGTKGSLNYEIVDTIRDMWYDFAQENNHTEKMSWQDSWKHFSDSVAVSQRVKNIQFLNSPASKTEQNNNVQIICESAPTLTNNPPNDIIKSRKKTVKDKGGNKMNKELIGREEIMRAIENEIVNPQDQFLVASVYFGIASIGSAGKGFASMTSLKVKDVDLEKNIIHIDGKDLEIPACMRRIVEGAIKQDVYFRKMRENDASFNTPEFNLNMASEYVFKSKMAVQTDNGLKPLTEWTIKKRFRNAVEGTSLELFNASSLKKAGGYDLLTAAKGKGIDLSTGDKINNFLVENNFSFSRKDIVAFTKMFKS